MPRPVDNEYSRAGSLHQIELDGRRSYQAQHPHRGASGRAPGRGHTACNDPDRAAQSAADDSLSLRLSGGPEAAATARHALARLRADIDPPLMETLRLLVTELVTNSVKHARADTVVLRVLVGPSSSGPR